ncbi:MAG: hypothetical protein IKM00_08935 [Clostridia bacterium]|nr:hypothetical protein [Clostridia bacterium]
MAIKMQVLHYPEKGKVATIASALATEFQAKCDKIPPAYGCTRERVVFIGISSKTKILDDALSRFLALLNREATQNVAIFTDAPEAAVEAAKAVITEAGANVIDVKTFKKNAFSFLTGVKPEEMEDIQTWANGIVAQVQE